MERIASFQIDHTRLKRGISMAQWLKDAVEGNVYDTGVKK